MTHGSYSIIAQGRFLRQELIVWIMSRSFAIEANQFIAVFCRQVRLCFYDRNPEIFLMSLDLAGCRVTVTGGAGFLGQAVHDQLTARGVSEIAVPRQREYNLIHEADTIRLYDELRPDVVLHLAGEVGGIGANRANPGRYFFANMAMALNLIEQARIRGIRKFVQVGTICAYPKITPVPFQEENLWHGYPEETNAPYGIAKKAALVMLDGYHRQYGLASSYLLPVNLYGPRDNFDPESSHVIPALIRKCETAHLEGHDSIECWGTGSASREFLYVDDAAEGIIRAAEVMEKPEPINLGTNREIAIRDLVGLIAKLVGFEGEIRWDPSKPDGQPRRCLDVTRAHDQLGWAAKMSFEHGLRRTIDWWRSVRPEKA